MYKMNIIREHLQHINKLLHLTGHNSYFFTEGLRQYFYKQETNISRNLFLQLSYYLMMDQKSPKLIRFSGFIKLL